MLCPSCGRENPEGFRFCGHCSASLEPAVSGGEVRKTVTVLFCDVTGSTTLGERLDPETVRRVMGRYFDEMRAVLESHGGTVEKFIGDAVMAVFGVPMVHEDDALRGVRAAQEMRERLQGLNEELERDHGVTIAVRIGVNTGEVVASTSGQTLATGDAVNLAARLEQAAAPNEILIGADTHRLVRDAVEVESIEPLEVKGKAGRVHAFRLISVAGAEGVARRFDVPMVGRVDELRALEEALRRAEHDRACVLVTVLGPAGVGKSRLLQEFLDRGDEAAHIVRGRCLPYGEGITYWPVVEMLTAAAGIAEGDEIAEVRGKILGLLDDTGDTEMIAERLAQLMGVAGAAAAPAETYWAVRRLLEAMAAAAPLVVVLDDIHWAEPALLDLIEHVAYWSREAPILLLCDARPDLLDRRPEWGGGTLSATSIVLDPLSDAECGELVASLLDHAELPVEARRTILEAAEGNPLFVEHMIAMLIDDGLLRFEGERWLVAGDLSSVSPPPSITALLEARLERLSTEERAVIERASIEGRTFHVGSVRSLGLEDAAVSEPLMALVRRDLIRPDRPTFAGEDALRFRHILIRDAAYNRIPKETRATLHRQHADWLERTAGDRLPEFEEIVGYHLEQAYRLRAELGPLGVEADELASGAVKHLVASGRRAADRGDASASSNLLSRAVDLLPAEHPDLPMLLADLSQRLAETGDLERAAETVTRAVETVGPGANASLEFRVRSARLVLDAAVAPEGVARRMKTEAEQMIPRLEATGDEEGLARAWWLKGEAELFWGQNAAMFAAFDRAIDHAERVGDRTTVGESVVWCMIGAAAGMTSPPSEGLALLDALAARAPEDINVMAWHQITRGRFLGMLGEIDEGRDLVRAGRAIFRDLGRTLSIGGSSMQAATFEEMAGDLRAAEREVRNGFDLLSTLGEKGYLSTAGGMLARHVARRGDLEDAEELARIGLQASATDDVYSQVWCRLALTYVHARRGDHARALELNETAVELAASTDDCEVQGFTLEDLAEIHRLAERRDESAQALRRAIDVWDRKGAVFVAERLRARLAELTGP